MEILNQPYDGSLGEELKSNLKKDYDHLYVISAFAKTSGVLRLKKYLENFKALGKKFDAYIGIDSYGTSYEALENLFYLCDSLYIIHNDNPSITFHSKIYLFTNHNSAWLSLGSNNLTGGGLWSNYESCTLGQLTSPKDKKMLNSVKMFINSLSDSSNPCSFKINSIDDINQLQTDGYIKNESILSLGFSSTQKATHKKSSVAKIKFGRTSASMPKITPSKPGAHISPSPTVSTSHPSLSNDDPSRIWFAPRKMTSASKNILDLSMQGKIKAGNAIGTTYYISPTHIKGGVHFFGINPTLRSDKNIKINYKGKDYSYSTVKYPTGGSDPNGTWRLQLKGENPDGNILSIIANHNNEFVYKILIFEKITDDYYSLTTADPSLLDDFKEMSLVVAANGKAGTGKDFGLY
jgi:HKD family nuclease